MSTVRVFTVGAILLLATATIGLLSGGASAQAPASPNGPFSSDKSASAPIAPEKSAPLDLNRAEEAELASLPGVGGQMAKAIVAGRPYTSKHELLDRKIVTATAYEHIKSLVTVN